MCSHRPPTSRNNVPLAVLAIAFLVVSNTWADTPGVTHIFPAGGQRGTTVPVRVGGYNLHDIARLELLGPGVAAPAVWSRSARTPWFEGPLLPQPESQQKEDYPRDYAGQITIAQDAPLGFRRLSAWTSQGATESLKFVVGELPELVEEESRGEPMPTPVKLPLTINGRLFPREDVDIWSFEAQAGESFACEVLAARLGSPVDSHLEVSGPSGRRVAENADYFNFGADSFIRFTAPENGTYQVHIRDANFGGLQHYVYRLTITGGPYVEHVFPLGGRRGTTVALQLAGQQVPEQPVSIALPEQGSEFVVSRLGAVATNPFVLELSDFPEVLETEPNEASESAPLLTLPVVANGRIERPGDVDAWRFEGKKDESLDVDLRAARLGSPLDSVVTINDAAGKTLATNDDMAAGQTDSRLSFKVPADGTYAVAVRDRFAKRGGPRYAYRLSITPATPAAPDFELRIPVDALTVNRGGDVRVKVTAERRGGFAEAIELRVENLPAGVTLGGDKIAAKQNETQLIFKADPAAKIAAQRVKIVGSAKLGEALLTCTAVKPASSRFDLDMENPLLAVAMPTPFKVKGTFETKFAGRGSTFSRHYRIERNGFAGPLLVSLADRQARHLQGVTGPTITVPAGESEFDYPIHLAPWMDIGRTSRTCVMAVGEIADADGMKHQVSYTSHEQNDQIVLIVDPGQLGLRVDHKSLLLQPGQTREVRVTVTRGANLRGPVTVEAILPDHIRGLTAAPLIIAAEESEGILRLQLAEANAGPFTAPLLVRATLPHAGFPYTAEENVELVLGR